MLAGQRSEVGSLFDLRFQVFAGFLGIDKNMTGGRFGHGGLLNQDTRKRGGEPGT